MQLRESQQLLDSLYPSGHLNGLAVLILYSTLTLFSILYPLSWHIVYFVLVAVSSIHIPQFLLWAGWSYMGVPV